MNKSSFLKIISLFFLFLLGSNTALFALTTVTISAQQQKLEERKLKIRLKKILHSFFKHRFIRVEVSSRYILHTDPLSKDYFTYRKIKLPGFESHIKAPNKAQALSFVSRTERYNTVFVILSKKIPKEKIPVFEDLLNQKLGLDFGGNDILKLVAIKPKIQNVNFFGDKKQKKDQKKNQKNGQNIETNLGQKKKLEKKKKKLIPNPKLVAQSTKHLIKARQAYFRNDLNGALNEVIESINILPESPKNYEMLGSIYYRLNWKDLAIQSWEKALELNPKNVRLKNYLVKIKKLP
ncbi:MAG: hypothetical protein ACI86H_002682 [bacterium]|jgi:hypothetical protein